MEGIKFGIDGTVLKSMCKKIFDKDIIINKFGACMYQKTCKNIKMYVC